MSIVTFLDGIIAKLGSPAPTFEIGVKSWQNVIADNPVFPIIFFEQPKKSEYDLKSNLTLQEKNKLILIFLDKSQLDMTANQLDTITSNMKELMRSFVLELSKDEKVKSISSIRSEEYFHVLDGECSGVVLFLDLILYPTESIC